MTTSASAPAAPTGLLWGAATAAFQIEGAAHLDGRADSIWDAFCRVPGAIADDQDGDVACDHYFRYAEDVALMRAMNLQAYRFSTSWARIRPDGVTVNHRGLDFYSRLVDELLGAGIQPWLTLYHWDLPQALEERGGWTDRETVHRFVDYALGVHEALGDRVDVWTTLNEPFCSAYLGYGTGHHAPGRRDRRASLAAVHHLLLAHGSAAAELRSRAPGATLGIALNLDLTDPADPADPADVAAARRVDGQWNRIFLDPIFRGRYPEDVLAETAHLGLLDHVRDRDLDLIATPIDVLGVNYYHGSAVSHRRPASVVANAGSAANPLPAADDVFRVPRGLPRTGMGWEVQPEGLSRLLLRLQDEYTGPAGCGLAVTENGAAYPDLVDAHGEVDDEARLAYLTSHVAAVRHAVARGVDVRAYFAWTLLDNFEWAYGYTQRFGLVHVDFATQQRIIKRSGLWYADVAAGVPPQSPESRQV